MPIERKRIGSGITKRTVTVISGPFEDDEIDLIQRSIGKTFEELHATAIERWAQRVLARERIVLGNPDSDPPTPPTQDGRSVAIGEGIVHDSEAAYALAIMLGLSLVRDAIADGDAAAAAATAFTLGEYACEARMKFKWEKRALDGVKRQKDRKKGGKAPKTKKGIAAAMRKFVAENSARTWEETWRQIPDSRDHEESGVIGEDGQDYVVYRDGVELIQVDEGNRVHAIKKSAAMRYFYAARK